ncbi:MAG TPA: TIGR02302 family protein, partial [Stellaceae bacterium]
MSIDTAIPPVRPAAPARLRRRLDLATVALAWERLWPAMWPSVIVVGVFLTLALFDIPTRLPASGHWLLLAISLVVLTLAVLDGMRRFSWPSRDDARRRLELASRLSHRPLTAIEDKLAGGGDDPAAAALWRAHQERMAAAAQQLKVGAPEAGLLRRDPFALRVALALLLLIAAIDAGDDWAGRLVRAFTPESAHSVAPQISLDIWVTPPDYTGLPPQFLPASGKQLIYVPIGSALLAQVHGGRNPPHLKVDAAASDFSKLDEKDFKGTATLTAGKHLAVEQDGRTLGAWNIAVVPDHPPAIAFAKPPSHTDRMALRLDYKANDDYGVESAGAVIRRLDDPSLAPLTLPLQLPGQHLTDPKGVGYFDLTANLWAGMPVRIELQAKDALGQTGTSETMETVLPERQFHNPVAKALVEQRKELSRKGFDKDAVADTISDLSLRPDRYNNDMVAYLGMRTAQARLHLDRDGSSIAPVQQLLWDTAVRIDEGRSPAAMQDLRNAMKQLQDALARNAPDDEIQRLMNQLQEAMNRYMQQLAQQMQNMDPSQLQPADPRNMLTMRDLQQMLDRARDLARTGAKDQARQMLSQLQQMLENLRMARPSQGRNGQQQQQMSQMQDMMRQQQQLLDRSFQQSRNGQQQNMQGDAQQQQALRQMLNQMMQQMQQQGGGVPQAMQRADRAMRGAEQALGQNQPGRAVGPQSDALDALGEAARSMANQMMGDNYGDGPGGEPLDNPGLHQAQRDPFGRLLDTENGNGGIDDGGTLRMGKSNESALDKAKEILEELRRRAGERE